MPDILRCWLGYSSTDTGDCSVLRTQHQRRTSNQPPYIRESQQRSFRWVMSDWYNSANKSKETLGKFNIHTLIQVFRNQNVGLFPLANELEAVEKKRNKSRPMNREWSSESGLQQFNKVKQPRKTSERFSFSDVDVNFSRDSIMMSPMSYTETGQKMKKI